MASSISPKDLVLTWNFDKDDLRKAQLYQQEEGQEPLKLYYFSSYQKMSTFYHFNVHTQRYENAGSIEWNSLSNIRLNLGIRSTSADSMARKNNVNSRSRRFKAINGIEYKWRQIDNEPQNLECLTVAGKKEVALYNNNDHSLLVKPRGIVILDDLVVLLLVHLYRRSQGFDFVEPRTSS